ncbi:MAG: hypothetical protein Q8O19_06940, partial [Rectinemataceae bacterium]|nr:hypothetical protein [Rectinemataceae bacterium]
MVTKFFLEGQIQEIPKETRPFDPEGMFVLLTTIQDRRELSDLRVLEAYKGQQVVEIGFHWLKGPLAVAPVFLKLPSRIEVLGFVYLISMFLYALAWISTRESRLTLWALLNLAQDSSSIPETLCICCVGRFFASA